MNNDDKEVWDNLLDSDVGIEVFAEMMKQAKKEVEEGKIEEN